MFCCMRCQHFLRLRCSPRAAFIVPSTILIPIVVELAAASVGGEHTFFRISETCTIMQMANKNSESVLSSEIYDAAVAGMKKATRLNQHSAATRKPTSPQNLKGSSSLNSLGPLFQSELKSIVNDANLPLPRSRHGFSPSIKHRNISLEDEKMADAGIVWPTVRFDLASSDLNSSPPTHLFAPKICD